MKVKRSLYVFFWIEDGPLFDITEFLQGELKASSKPQLLALSLLTESQVPMTFEEFRLLTKLLADSWTEAAKIDAGSVCLKDLAAKGLLLADSDDPHLAHLRWRDELLHAQQWHPYAACYHFMTREREKNAPLPWAKVPKTEDLAAAVADDTARFVRRFGLPPPPFRPALESVQRVDLPRIEKSGDFYEVLSRRKSTRAFESAEPLKLEDFTALLHYVFGCQGYARMTPDVVVLHKTSASGGALHPIEAYPLVLNVESLAPGFYHYDVENHSLELVRQLATDEARDLGLEISGGQTHARAAHALVVMTARFLRYFWKYRQRSQAYGSVLMDVGHLSQTFYLVATELGLGVFFSSVVDGPRVEEVLGLKAQEESAVAICACGVKAREGHDLGLDFEPYVPRETSF